MFGGASRADSVEINLLSFIGRVHIVRGEFSSGERGHRFGKGLQRKPIFFGPKRGGLLVPMGAVARSTLGAGQKFGGGTRCVAIARPLHYWLWPSWWRCPPSEYGNFFDRTKPQACGHFAYWWCSRVGCLWRFWHFWRSNSARTASGVTPGSWRF